MKINWHLINYDMLDDLHLPKCPTLFRTEAENIITVIAETEPFSYTKMSAFDKRLVAKYWAKYDSPYMLNNGVSLEDWYIKYATDPDLISRARRWLIEHNYLIPTKGISERAQESSEKWKATIKGG